MDWSFLVWPNSIELKHDKQFPLFAPCAVHTIFRYLLASFRARPPEKLSPEVLVRLRKITAEFEGGKGYVAKFGDSITYSMAFRDRVLVIAFGRQICYSLVLDALLTTADPDSLCPARFIGWSAVPQ